MLWGFIRHVIVAKVNSACDFLYNSISFLICKTDVIVLTLIAFLRMRGTQVDIPTIVSGTWYISAADNYHYQSHHHLYS